MTAAGYMICVKVEPVRSAAPKFTPAATTALQVGLPHAQPGKVVARDIDPGVQQQVEQVAARVAGRPRRRARAARPGSPATRAASPAWPSSASRRSTTGCRIMRFWLSRTYSLACALTSAKRLSTARRVRQRALLPVARAAARLRPRRSSSALTPVHQPLGEVLDHHVLQREAVAHPLQQRAPLQRAQRFHERAARRRLHQVAAQHGRRGRLALDRQPNQQLLLQRRQAGKLLVEHRADVVEDRRFFAQESRRSCRQTAPAPSAPPASAPAGGPSSAPPARARRPPAPSARAHARIAWPGIRVEPLQAQRAHRLAGRLPSAPAPAAARGWSAGGNCCARLCARRWSSSA